MRRGGGGIVGKRGARGPEAAGGGRWTRQAAAVDGFRIGEREIAGAIDRVRFGSV